MAKLVTDPVYVQLCNELRKLIVAERIEVGTRFPTEREVSTRFGVSRATANKAVSSLVSEGVLEFRKGVGTFVRPHALDYDLRSLVSFTDKARAAGKRPSTTVFEFQTGPAEQVDRDIADTLQVQPSDAIHRMERLRLADDVPMILERRFVVAEHCPELTREDVAGSLYALWTDRYELEIAGADEILRAVTLRGEDAERLQIDEGTAAFLVISTGYLSRGRPLWHERTLYNGNHYEFHNSMGQLDADRPDGRSTRTAQLTITD